jgi:Mn2+/Fe2+ NRAMP family transporter
LKYLTLAFFAYIITAFLVQQDWTKILITTIVPYISLDKAFFLAILAILGTNISPYLFFWQSDEEVEEEVEYKRIRAMGRGVPKFTGLDLRNLKLDTAIGMIFSNIIVLFIGITAAATLGRHGLTSVQTAADAAQALKPLAGNFAFLLFTIGIMGSGLMAVPVLAGAGSYAISEALGWKEGLYRKFTQAHGFYGVMTFATLIGILINFTPIKPIQMLVYAAALNAILAPFLIILIIIVSNNKKIMGEHTNSMISNILGLLITGLMIAASAALLFNL